MHSIVPRITTVPAPPVGYDHNRTLLLLFFIGITFQLDAKRTAIKVTDRKQRAREIFMEKGQLPGEGGGSSNPLLELWQENYAVEIFYFPASSLEITNILRCACA